MSTGDRTWQCQQCPVNYSGGEDLIKSQSVAHMHETHGAEILPEQVLAEASEPEV